MTFSDLTESIRPLRSALFVGDLVPHGRRRFMDAALLILMVAAALSISLGWQARYERTFLGVFLLALVWFIVLRLIEAFENSVTAFSGSSGMPHLTSIEVARILYHSDPDSITRHFALSDEGEYTLLRAGISPESLAEFIEKGRATGSAPQDFMPLTAAAFDAAGGITDQQLVRSKGVVTLSVYAQALFNADPAFRQFLLEHGVQAEMLAGAADWAEEILSGGRKAERWWSRDMLGAIPGIAKDWAYGGTYSLDKYVSDLTQKSRPGSLGSAVGLREADEIEEILSRGRDANVVMVGDDDLRKKTVLNVLAERIREGVSQPVLEHRRLLFLHAASLLAGTDDKAAFEKELQAMLVEAHQAGNVLLAVDDFAELLSGAARLGADLPGLLIPFLGKGNAGSSIQFIVLMPASSFQTISRENPSLMGTFERVQIESTDEMSVLRALEERALALEKRTGAFFTYAALRTVARGAVRFFPGTMTLDKAYDILHEMIPQAAHEHKVIIGQAEASRALEFLTGVPAGEVSVDERERLLNLEAVLHKRIMGQDAAVTAIANALRRARSGIENTARPMGSFLFLGPTGVGKTETTKALAAAFFGGEHKILRLDMSEYRTADALDRLIGSFQSGKQGALPTLLSEHPYGVLLLDEFEKTSREVLDLFLQIIDEGFFTDAFGKKVNARNLIIIATSNAGSDIIFKIVESGQKPADHREEIVDAIVAQGIFKPELLNRFDGVIFFEPLSAAELRRIAELAVKALSARLAEKGIELVMNDALLDALVAAGSDNKFGARPMQRAVQDKVEQVIARKMIAGEISSGSKVELTVAELA